MKFLNFIHLVISTIFFNYVASSGSIGDERVERCVEQRVRDNENSWNEWENLHPFFVGDARAQVNMTRRNLQSINQTLFQLSGTERRSSPMIVDLSINKISVIESGAFERLHNLRILLLRVNRLGEITASQFKGLMALEELDLSSNSIHSIERDALGSMERLRTIDLSANCLFELRPYIFFRNVRLINIFLGDNFLDTLPVLMPFSQQIDYLNVTANRFTNLTSLIYYESVRSLDVSHNPLVSMSEDMSGHVTDVAGGNGRRGGGTDSSDTSSRSGEGDNYTMRLNYNSNEYIQRRPRSRRHDNQDYFSRASAVNSIGKRCAQARGDFAEYNGDARFKPDRKSEEALEALIRISLNATDTEMVALCSALYGRRKLMKRSPRNGHYVTLTRQQIQQLREYKRINRLEYFTCRNCTLHSLGFLLQFSKLKYVDVSSNMIKSVDSRQLTPLEHMEYLDVSDNGELESLNLQSLLQNWPNFNALILNNNPNFNCDLVTKMRTHVEHLNKAFRLEISKCKRNFG